MNCVFCRSKITDIYYCVDCMTYWLDTKTNKCHSCNAFSSMTSCQICDICNIEYPEYNDLSIIMFYFNKDLSICIWHPRILYDKKTFSGTYTFDDNNLSIGNSKYNIIEPHKIPIKPNSSEELFLYSKKLLKLNEYL